MAFHTYNEPVTNAKLKINGVEIEQVTEFNFLVIILKIYYCHFTSKIYVFKKTQSAFGRLANVQTHCILSPFKGQPTCSCHSVSQTSVLSRAPGV